MNSAAHLWIKVCANTSLADARIAAEAGADAVGFVFAPSPRRVTAEQAAEIAPHLPEMLEKIGVFVGAGVVDIVAAVRQCGLTGVQLHADAAEGLPARLHAELGAGIRILRVVHYGPDAAAEAQRYAADPDVAAVLVDSRTATAVGGTGVRFDWQEARTLFGDAGGKMIVAGGLTPENVAAAIKTLHPLGVDVASGVEAAPGKKDPDKVRRFIANARAAGRSFASE